MVRLSRREVGLGALATAATLLPRSGFSRTHADNPLNNLQPADKLNTMIRMMARTDGGIAIRWMDGVLSGIVEQQTQDLLGVSQQIFSRHRRNEDGSFEAVYLELVYFTDLATGEVLEEWDNPYTGRATAVPTQALGPTQFHIPLSLKVVNQPFPIEGIRNDHWMETAPSDGTEIIFQERINSYVPPMTDGGAPIEFYEIFKFRAPTNAVLGSDAPHVSSLVDKLNVISWRPWMDMDEIDGVSMSQGSGRVITDYDDLPSDLSAKNEEHFPGVIAELEDYVTFGA